MERKPSQTFVNLSVVFQTVFILRSWTTSKNEMSFNLKQNSLVPSYRTVANAVRI